MKPLRVIALLPLLCVVGAGCVMKSTYEQALADLDATRAEVEQAKSQARMLERETAELERLKADLSQQFELATVNLQQARQDMEAEQAAAQRQLSQLNQKLNQLTAQQNSLRLALQRAQDERPALQTTIDRFKTKLGEMEGPRTSSFAPPAAVSQIADGAQPSPSVESGKPMADPAVQPTATTTSASMDQSAGTSDRPATGPSEPADEGLLAAIMGWVLSIWHTLFS